MYIDHLFINENAIILKTLGYRFDCICLINWVNIVMTKLDRGRRFESPLNPYELIGLVTIHGFTSRRDMTKFVKSDKTKFVKKNNAFYAV